MKYFRSCHNKFFEKFFSVSVMMTCMYVFALNAYAEHDEAVSGTAAKTVPTGGENRLSFLIGAVFLTVGAVGFVLLKLRDRKLNDNTL